MCGNLRYGTKWCWRRWNGCIIVRKNILVWLGSALERLCKYSIIANCNEINVGCSHIRLDNSSWRLAVGKCFGEYHSFVTVWVRLEDTLWSRKLLTTHGDWEHSFFTHLLYEPNIPHLPKERVIVIDNWNEGTSKGTRRNCKRARLEIKMLQKFTKHICLMESPHSERSATENLCMLLSRL